VSADLAVKLEGVSSVHSPVSVKVANGEILSCTSQIAQAKWVMAGYSFKSDLNVLRLSSYDMIVGMDWLERYNPMKVHWKHKWMSIPYEGATALLCADMHELPVGSMLQLCFVHIAISDSVAVDIPGEVQQLIGHFEELFEVPFELPPKRACDHEISLIPGSTPVQVRPYRYAPALKEEIEKQIKEMLNNGIIQPSNSPFSSSVLLVKKKDNTWRFCVDYRHLNAITVKGKYPVPVIDEFLDELAHASWFTCLDLRARFHQIRLTPGEEFKTAFQTHFS
jgi:hypothetical protein